MKFLIVALAVACAQALPQQDQNAEILRQNFNINEDGAYQWDFESSNGIQAQAEGHLAIGNSEYPALEVKGSSRHISPEGENVELSYVADEYGYQPQGSHLPTPPPTPDYILRSIQYIEDYIRSHPLR
ncbi:insect cuticle protein domain-containing protein [Phthorimaea operculella]|nr:insect cuticle protein domain-containing protein [Phthorimaea operculella]